MFRRFAANFTNFRRIASLWNSLKKKKKKKKSLRKVYILTTSAEKYRILPIINKITYFQHTLTKSYFSSISAKKTESRILPICRWNSVFMKNVWMYRSFFFFFLKKKKKIIETEKVHMRITPEFCRFSAKQRIYAKE